MAYRDQPLGELALSIPRASALFRKYDMDYCCGGKQTLARAAARKELDVEVIEAELAKLAEQPIEKDWRSAPLAEIIDHIIVRYHDRHREQLPELILHALIVRWSVLVVAPRSTYLRTPSLGAPRGRTRRPLLKKMTTMVHMS